MYLEACRSFDRNDGPEALHIVGYELREFMNVLLEVLDLPTEDHELLRGKTKDFARGWEAGRSSSGCHNAGNWSGTIDRELDGILQDADKFVLWVKAELPSRKLETEWVLKKLLPTDYPMPKSLVERGIALWSEMLRYFNALTHHDIEPSRDAVEKKIETLEIFLLNRLEPRTFKDQDDIDQLIAEVESSQ